MITMGDIADYVRDNPDARNRKITLWITDTQSAICEFVEDGICAFHFCSRACKTSERYKVIPKPKTFGEELADRFYSIPAGDLARRANQLHEEWHGK